MRLVTLFSVVAPTALLLCFGCSSQDKTDPAGTSTTTSTSGGSTSSSTTSSSTPSTSSTTGTATADASKPAGPTPSLSDIPADLKSDGYYYYGLDNPKPMNIELRDSTQPTQVHTGTQTIFLKEIKNGVPIFEIDRTGDLAELGEQELRLDKDGLINVASTVAKIGPHDIEMPAKLTPGSSWPSHTEVEKSDQSMSLENVFKVVGPEKVKTPAGEHDAILITSTGKGTNGGKKVTTTFKGWFVKDLGNVKTVLTITTPNGPPREITMQEIK